MAKILLTGGGTAGHCTPNIALIPHLKEKFSEIYYVGSYNGIERKIVEKEDIPYFPITTVKLERKLTPKNLSIPFKLIKGINEANTIIKQLKPDVVFSKGGFVSVPLVISAHKNKIPVVIHESDFSLGLANKISIKYSNKLITSFPDTAKEIKKATYIGSPIRNIKLSQKNYNMFGFDGSKPVLLVFGGSLGASAINKVMFDCARELVHTFDVVHICGKDRINQNLINLKGYYQTEYLFNMQDALSIASICVARAGANSLFELLSLKKPCVIIPLPKGISRGDQEENANYFNLQGLINLLEQEKLTNKSFINAINDTYKNRNIYIDRLSINPISDKGREIANLLFSYLN